jgi:M6 family metalloprotease-like protein
MKIKLASILLFSIILGIQTGSSVPAYPGIVQFLQSDGSLISIFLKGDEFVSWAETTDGYTLLFNNRGGYDYAVRGKNNLLEPSGLLAHNIPYRTANETLLLANNPRGLAYSAEQIRMLKSLNQIYTDNIQTEAAFPTTGSRKLICILMGFKDQAFSKTQADFNNLLNQIQYTVDGATGSVKDYFREVSYNKLDLSVTVAGPYTAANNMSYYGKQSGSTDDVNPGALITEAVNYADPDVNFAEFDNDNNGSVDGVYVIFAGYGQEAGASTDAIWSHSSSIPTLYKDGKSISKYACSCELRGNSGSGITRIGVICHEFGHVLGSPDFYDTDYETGGSYEGTKTWDLMASGSWNNNGATPAHPSGFVKVLCYSWASVTELTAAAIITLNNAAEYSNSFYKLNTTTSGEYFFIENRERHLFDAYIPGSGLIIYHVHKDVFSSGNVINATHPQKMYPVSQNATSEPNSTPSSYGSIASATCAWTGTGKNEFSDTSVPSSKSWAGNNTGKPVTNILRDAVNKTVTFSFNQPSPDLTPPVAGSATGVTQTGFNANWSPVTVATGYYLDVSASSTFGGFVTGYNNKDVGNILISTVTGLTPGITYYYRVRAYSSTKVSVNSNTVSVTLIPPAPVAVSASVITQNSFNANWSTTTGATGYYLDVSTNNTFTEFVTGFNNLSVGFTTSFPVNGLTSCTGYYYRVRAANLSGSGLNSNVISTKTTCEPAAVLTIGEASGPAGSSVCIPVSATGLTDAVGFQFTLAYDPSKLTYLNCSDWGGGTNSPAVQVTSLTGGKVTFVYNDAPVNLESGKFFDICFAVIAGSPGTVSVTWSDIPTLREFSNSSAGEITCTYIDGKVIVTNGWTLSGTLAYPHYSTQTQTPLSNTPVILYSSGNVPQDTSNTDISGIFSFAGLLNGDYTLKPFVNQPWGGVTAMDLTSYKKHIGGAVMLEPIQIRSGDVNGSGALTAMDLTFIKQRIGALISSFPAGDYAFYPDTFTIGNADFSQDIRTLCYGDANGSYSIEGSTKALSYILLEDESSNVVLSNDGHISVPFRVNRAMKKLSSVTLSIQYPSEYFEVQNVEMVEHNEDLFFTVKDGIVRIIFSSLIPIDLKEGDVLLTISISPKKSLVSANEGMIRIDFTGQGEFGDYNGNVLEGVTLLYAGLLKNIFPDSRGRPEIVVYPNPAYGKIYIQNGEGSEITLLDMLGKPVVSISDIGDLKEINLSNLLSGTYLLRIKHQNKLLNKKITIIK